MRPHDINILCIYLISWLAPGADPDWLCKRIAFMLLFARHTKRV